MLTKCVSGVSFFQYSAYIPLLVKERQCIIIFIVVYIMFYCIYHGLANGQAMVMAPLNVHINEQTGTNTTAKVCNLSNVVETFRPYKQ